MAGIAAGTRSVNVGTTTRLTTTSTNTWQRGMAATDWIAPVLAVLVVAWLSVVLFSEWVAPSIRIPERLWIAEDVAAGVARLFAALALSLVPRDANGQRLHWLAAGFLVLGIGQFTFGYLTPNVLDWRDPTTDGRYEAFLVRLLAGIIFALALIPSRPPPIGSWVTITVAMSILTAYVLIDLYVGGNSEDSNFAGDSTGLSLVFDQSTSWISWAYIGLAFTAAVGANRQHRLGNLPDWLLVALVLWTGALLHDALWPGSYSSTVLTTGDMLRLGFTVTVAIGSVVELRRIAAERASLLAAEQEYSRQIAELSKIRTDFNRMVIHELGAPASTIRNFTDVLAMGEMRPADQAAIVAMMRSESERMLSLIDDVQSVAAVERDEFSVTPRPVAVADIVADANVFITGLGTDHPISIRNEADGETVSADPMRIGQVLRNLLGNAAKYTPAGTSIALRVSPIGPDKIRFEVEDEGAGINSSELEQIFEKYERGNSPTAALVVGKGLGLYLSRRIVRLHGSDLRVTSTPGAGAVFSFELNRVEP